MITRRGLILVYHIDYKHTENSGERLRNTEFLDSNITKMSIIFLDYKLRFKLELNTKNLFDTSYNILSQTYEKLHWFNI